MFHIKICGVRSVADVEAVVQSPADAIGLNFYDKSIRYLDPDHETTRQLSDYASQRQLERVGVFVNESFDAIRSINQKVGLDHVQLHGDESPELASQLIAGGMSVIRAIKLPATIAPYAIADQVTKWLDAGCVLLFDYDAGADHGGSGQRLDWPVVGEWADQYPDVEWLLAGGLGTENVARAIEESHAVAVDVASGVEEPRGEKSAELIRLFAERAAKAMG